MAATPGLVWAERATGRTVPSDFSFLRRTVLLRSRSDWAVEPPILSRLNRADPYFRITVHHQGRAAHQMRSEREAALAIQNVQEGHLRRRFGDIGYHLIIDPAGRAWEGRSLRYCGAHVSRQNPGNIGIMLLGNFEEQRPTQQQLTSLHHIVTATMNAFHLSRRQVYGHCDLGHTLCPGSYLYGHVEQIRTART